MEGNTRSNTIWEATLTNTVWGTSKSSAYKTSGDSDSSLLPKPRPSSRRDEKESYIISKVTMNRLRIKHYCKYICDMNGLLLTSI